MTIRVDVANAAGGVLGGGPGLSDPCATAGPDATRVDLTHRHLERCGPEAGRMRRILDGKGGEPLQALARHIAAGRQPDSQQAPAR